MKIPKTFIPEKNLGEKTDDLLEGRVKTCRHVIDAEASCLFPNFTDYLKEVYSSLVIQKLSDKQWGIYGSHHPNVDYQVGIIRKYFTHRGVDISEYGYDAIIIIRDKELELSYREGYYSYDINGKMHHHKDPERQDPHDIPFP